jgi:hypothetical protein
MYLFDPEYKNSTSLLNVGKISPHYTALYQRRKYSPCCRLPAKINLYYNLENVIVKTYTADIRAREYQTPI